MQSTRKAFMPTSLDRIADAIPKGLIAGDGTTPDVVDEFHHFVADMEELVGTVTSATGDELVRVKTKLRARVALAKRSIQDMSDGIARSTRKP